MHMQTRLHLDESELRHCVRRLPALMGYSHEANIAPKLDRLQADLSEALTLTLALALALTLTLSLSLTLTLTLSLTVTLMP